MEPSWRFVGSLLAHRDFRLLLCGQSASTVGDRIVFVALALYVTDIGSPSDVHGSRAADRAGAADPAGEGGVHDRRDPVKEVWRLRRVEPVR
jgi:hypothetical protein